ncbi:CLUMA_CG016097, isoform A [Clunio marinus]|uniref:CLUMA_CG016097, isoform A n=1 Tax=Clunio marinus TaxID=568069 RepID=A0A1J1IVN2_9DIPT|nr:CLUMA_CG016097, isoform A [Clunio marinus]
MESHLEIALMSINNSKAVFMLSQKACVVAATIENKFSIAEKYSSNLIPIRERPIAMLETKMKILVHKTC